MKLLSNNPQQLIEVLDFDGIVTIAGRKQSRI
jgi:hypothetical protein